MLNVALISLSVLATSVQAHNSSGSDPLKPLNNPIYSAHDYKHPNVAAIARHWENKTAVKVKQSTYTDTQLANYKIHPPIDQAGGSVTLPYIRQNDLSNRNYKNQHLSNWQSSDSKSDGHVKKHHKNHHMTVGH